MQIYLRSPLVIATTLIGLALVLVLAEKAGGRTKGPRTDFLDRRAGGGNLAHRWPWFPASHDPESRSPQHFSEDETEAAARFSFFLATPIIAGAAGKQLFDMTAGGTNHVDFSMLVVGIITSAIVGYLAIAFLLRYLATNTTYAFIYYRIGLGIVVFLAFWSGFR